MFSKKGDGKGDVTAAELRDPDVVRTKGAPRVRKQNQNRRKCAACKLPGHTKRTCPVRSTKNKVKRARTMRMDAGDVHVGAACTGGHTTKRLDIQVILVILIPCTISTSRRVEEAELGSYGSGLREGTVGGLDVEDAKTSKLMDMVASLAKAL
ncbi:hypothetical protein AHAS_Ahas11G0094700 [Arachis hypogaea]